MSGQGQDRRQALGEALTALLTEAQDGAAAERLAAIESELVRLRHELGRIRGMREPLTAAEAAAVLKCGKRRVLDLIDSGELRARRFGREWRIRPEWIDAFMDGEDGASRRARALAGGGGS